MSEQQQQQRTEHDDQAQVAQTEDQQTRLDPGKAGQQAVADTEQHVAQQRSPGADYQAPEEKRLKWLQGQREGLIALYKAGKIDAATAIAKAFRYDQHINSGVSSVEGTVMIAQLGLDLAQLITAEAEAETEQEKPRAPVVAAIQPEGPQQQAPQQQAPQQQAPQQQAPQQQQVAQAEVRPIVEKVVTSAAPGSAQTQATTPAEAKVLNAVRGLAKRFDPAWLSAAQSKLGVSDPTGAFTTETLRAMRRFAADPALGAKSIEKLDFLQSIHPGQPFLAAESGHARQAADTSKDTPADRTAQALGYASYSAYKKTWVSIELLGVKLRGNGHPHLAARMNAANAYLRNRHAGLSDEEIRGVIGWNAEGNAAYAAEASSGLAHVHTMGIALDINRAQNPWIFRGKTKHNGNESDDWYEKFFKIVTRIYGGNPLSAKKLQQLGNESSTEELHAEIAATSQATEKYLELCKADQETQRATLAKAGFSDAEIRELLPKMPMHFKIFHNKDRKQTNAKSITDISSDLLIALRDAAGLAWGGTDFPGANEQGDFMHFDCRADSWGASVYRLGLSESRRKG
jgi:hypothetical protein